MDADGTVLEEFSYGNRSDEVLKTAKRCKAKYGQCQAVCESTGNLWVRTADAFEKAGVPLQLANTYKTKAIAFAKVKKDPVDARMLAHLLRSDLISPCHIGTVASRGNKQLLRYEIQLIQERTRVINFLHSLTDKYDVDPKEGGGDIWREKTLKFLEGVRLGDPSDQFVLESCITRIRNVNAEIDKSRQKIARFVKGNRYAKLLLSLIGIDMLSAALLAAEIDDVSRFERPGHLISWAGMCPTLHQSGDVEYHGRASKATNRTVNWIMIQCALVASTHDPRMHKYYERLKTRHKPIVALAHLANKLLRIIWYMLTGNVTYEGVNKARYRVKLKKIMNA